jgi:lambda repressor-like predicted transcriptional regulator
MNFSPSFFRKAFSMTTLQIPASRPGGFLPPLDHPFADGRYLVRVISYLREVRKERGITLRELSSQCGVKLKILSEAERENVIPPSREFKAWANALDVSWEQLWSWNFPLSSVCSTTIPQCERVAS